MVIKQLAHDHEVCVSPALEPAPFLPLLEPWSGAVYLTVHCMFLSMAPSIVLGTHSTFSNSSLNE